MVRSYFFSILLSVSFVCLGLNLLSTNHDVKTSTTLYVDKELKAFPELNLQTSNSVFHLFA